MAMFDDDEEDPPVGFEQDPDEDELGTGTWIYKDGSRRYSKGDAKEAKALLAKKPLTDAGAKLAGGDFTTPKTEATREGMTDAAAGLAGEKSPEEQFLSSTTGAEAEDLAAGDAAEAPERPVSLGGARPEPATPAGTMRPAPLPGASGPARYTDRSEASESATSGASQSASATRSGQARGDFDAQQGAIAKSYGDQIDAASSGAQGQAQSIMARRDALMQLAADKEAATVAAQAQNERRKLASTEKIREVGARKTDHNKLWKDKGALGTTLGLLGVALRSLNATKFGGPNTALQSIQEQRKQNIQAQMEDRDSELRGLEKELGSIEAAVPVLEARMRDAEIKRLDGMLADEKSQEVLANGQQLMGKLATERDSKLAEAARVYEGTIATQQSEQSSLTQGAAVSRDRISGAGVGGEAKGKTRADVYADLLELDKKEEERGVPKEDRAQKWAEYGFKPPAGESAPESMNREQREKVERDESNLSEDEKKAEMGMKLLDGYGSAAGLKRDPKTGKWVEPGVLVGTVKPGWSEGLRDAAGQSTPVRDRRRAAVQGVSRLLSGAVMSEKEAEEIGGLIGDETASANQLASRLNAAEDLVNERRKMKFKKQSRSAPEEWKSKPAEPSP